MIKFLIKGLLRDKNRSLFPIIVVTIGVMLTVLVHCWITGIIGDMVDFTARFSSGHVKIMSRAYAENENQVPNDLALIGVDSLVTELQKTYPDMKWVQRIRFGGLLDAPDENGETRSQGPSGALAVDLQNKSEVNRFNIKKSLLRGTMPQKTGEILVSDQFASKLEVKPGDTVTLISTTMYGGMSMTNFVVCGTVEFGIAAMDRGMIIVNLADAKQALDMHDAAGEILGYFPDKKYDDLRATDLQTKFNSKYSNPEEQFSPQMFRLRELNDMESMMEYISTMIGFFIFIFVLAMSLVLWNTGLIGGLRRYGEVGVRLAIGEHKGHIYRSMIAESFFSGLIGSITGTLIGLGLAYILQEKGFDVGSFLKSSTMMMPNVYRAKITSVAYYIGFVPGLFSTVLGTVLSGIGIYRRQTAQLFKELEA